MLTFCEHLVRSVCADLDAELRKFNCETDHGHLLAHYPSLALSVLVNRLKGVSSRRLRPAVPHRDPENTCGARISGARPTSPPSAEALR